MSSVFDCFYIGFIAAVADLPPFIPYPDAILSQLSIYRGFTRVGRRVVVESRFVWSLFSQSVVKSSRADEFTRTLAEP